MQVIYENSYLLAGFVQSRQRFPEHNALVVNGNTYTYRTFGQLISNIAITILENDKLQDTLVALLSSKTLTSYAGVLGILASGKGYVPLNPKFPVERIYKMLLLSNSGIIITDRENLSLLRKLLSMIGEESMTIILVNVKDTDELSQCYSRHHFITEEMISKGPEIPDIPRVREDAIAYLMFTSGSTGTPKGVPVSHKNVSYYLKYMSNRYDFDENDRFSQAFELSFDLSVHDMFLCWLSGACLYPVPDKYLMAPAKFIKYNELTVSFLVPSVAMFMSRMKMLKAGIFPSLHYSFFCGEPLNSALAEKWQDAAPNAIVENLYGPTEATVAISHYRWNREKSQSESLNGIVPLGNIFGTHKSCIIDDDLKTVEAGSNGELCLAGPQVTNGYLNSPEKTCNNFVKILELGGDTWYRTGDLVMKKDNCLHYLGRKDNQVKILGHRVELQEIDYILRRASGTDMAISVPLSVDYGNIGGIAAFIYGDRSNDESSIMSYCRKYLPDYMIPQKVYFIDNMPLTSNGKIDRLKLIEKVKG